MSENGGGSSNIRRRSLDPLQTVGTARGPASPTAPECCCAQPHAKSPTATVKPNSRIQTLLELDLLTIHPPLALAGFLPIRLRRPAASRLGVGPELRLQYEVMSRLALPKGV